MNDEQTHHFQQRMSLLIQLIVLLGALLALTLVALIFGPGLEPGSWEIIVIPIATLSLAGLLALFVWMLRRRPTVLRVGPAGLELPIVFKGPLPWHDIHRIRLSQEKSSLYGTRLWLIVDPSPGVLAPLRLPVWRSLELKFQKYHGVRIPLHGIEGDPEAIIASIERFRPVARDAD